MSTIRLHCITGDGQKMEGLYEYVRIGWAYGAPEVYPDTRDDFFHKVAQASSVPVKRKPTEEEEEEEEEWYVA